MKPLFALIIVFASTAFAQPKSTNLIAHEWGTFTSLQDSEGTTVEGLAHEEEALPSFVHGRAKTLFTQEAKLFEPSPVPTGPHCCIKDAEFIPVAGTPMTVTQKMETPVIYFYSQAPQSVAVDVDFPGGIITQYYPDVTSFSPPLGKVTSVANGHVHWDLEISGQNLPVPPVEDGSIWAPSRKTQSNFISAHSENEKLLFYRGLGNFKTQLQIIGDAHDGIQILNHSPQTIQDAFLLRVTASGNSIRKLGSIPAQAQIGLSKDDLTQLPQGNALDLVATALEKSGLYHDEAQAMVHTWEKSYFKTPGFRVLYVLPREWTDALLPLGIRPAPTELVRTLVGRVEVLTSSEENTLLASLKTSFQSNPTSSILPSAIQNLGRFSESKLRRVLQIAERENDPASFISYLEQLITTSEQQ
jgi:hypothetical protein